MKGKTELQLNNKYTRLQYLRWLVKQWIPIQEIKYLLRVHNGHPSYIISAILFWNDNIAAG